MLTIMLTPFMSCATKITIYGFFTAAFFPGQGGLIMTCLYLLGILVGIGTALVFSYVRGSATPRSGIAVMLCMLFSLSGLILSLFSGKDQDKLQLFSRIGLVLNAAVLCLCGVILYYGVI